MRLDQPINTVVVVHVEGGTAGTDTSAGLKRYQVVNKAKFVAKWEHELARRPPLDPAHVEAWAHRGQGEGSLALETEAAVATVSDQGPAGFRGIRPEVGDGPGRADPWWPP